MTQEAAIRERFAHIRARIAAAAVRAGRSPGDVCLIAVSKMKPTADIAAAFAIGQRDFAENYMQEAVPKLRDVEACIRARLPGEEAATDAGNRPRWHFIGSLQRNKARDAVQFFDCFHALDRAKLADALEKRAADLDRHFDVLLQVDLANEPQKGGVPPDALPALAHHVAGLPHLRAIGLMAVPPACADPEQTRPHFAALRALRDRLRDVEGLSEIRELSMGMSGDFEVAIEEGATFIRVGTALFGSRDE